MNLESLRALVEDGAAAKGIALRKLWRWTFEAILNDELDGQYPHDPRFNTPDIEEAHWRRLLAANLDADVSLCGWTSDLRVDRDRFNKWLKRRCRDASPPKERPGPKSIQREMREAYDTLLRSGARFTSRKEAHRGVLERCRVEERNGKLPRGWGYDTFLRACFPDC